MLKIKAITIAVFATLALTSEAAPRTKAQMQAIATRVINQHHSAKGMAPRHGTLKVLKETASYEIIGYEEGSFAVVSADDLVPEVLGVSASTYSEGRNKNFQWWLNAMDAVVRHAASTGTQLKTTQPDPEKYPTEVEPLMTTLWYQSTPYNNMCPDYSPNVKCLTGCVATAMAQVLRYHKTPEHGQGSRTIYYPQNSYSGQPVTANFEEDYYDWDNMLDIYEDNYTAKEADAVALLMRDCGVAADMQYGGPNEGSGAYSTDAAQGLRRYFGFDDAQCLNRDYYSESQWMDMVYREISENGPLYYGGADYFQGGHACVLHGYRADGMVYVNWGWAGQDDGYYDIALLNPSGMGGFKSGQDMIIGVKSDNHNLAKSVSVTVTDIDQLKTSIEALEEPSITSLTVSGPLSNEDLFYLRYLVGRDAEGAETGGTVRSLNLSEVTLPNNSIPAGLFKNCTNLRRVVLPASLEHIGAEAFRDCKKIYELRIETKQVPVLDGSNVFNGMSFGSAYLYVRSGLRSKYLQKAQWNLFGANNIIEFGTSIKVRNAIRKYGEENPTFYYTIDGEAVEGKPVLTCEATPESPAGRYPITISRGTIADYEDIDLYDGYLVVQKVDAKAVVGSYTRLVGKPNPVFGIDRYEGLIQSESAPVWLTEPVFECEADEQSPAGEYPITVKTGAEAESYNMSFIPGVLTVSSITTGIHELTTQQQEPVYTLDGRRIKGQPSRGLYIKGNKKVLMR